MSFLVATGCNWVKSPDTIICKYLIFFLMSFILSTRNCKSLALNIETSSMIKIWLLLILNNLPLYKPESVTPGNLR